MKNLLKIVLCSASLLAPSATLGVITMDCPSGAAHGAICTAYGKVNSWVPAGSTGECYVRIDVPSMSTVFRNSYRLADPQCQSQSTLQSFIERQLLSGLRIASIGRGGHPWGFVYSCTSGSCLGSTVETKPGPKPISCSMDKDLVFDYGQTPPGMINKTLVETLSINCTGKTSIKLTLQKSNQGKISLGSSGLTATLQANDLALGSRISLLKGTSPVRISSALSGNTSASGPQAGSGVLILDVLE